ncbi:MAG: hypothetical protein EXR69_03840 [Myxococcales bacterium]|nr:hypothetical protein [Myxococcales bacterium]
MSRRRNRRPVLPRGSWRPAALALAMVLLGASVCTAGAPWIASRLGNPVALDAGRWTLLVPGRKEGIASSAAVGGSGVLDGRLVLITRSLGRADILVPHGEPIVGGLDVELGADSGTLLVNVRRSTGDVVRALELGPSGWRTGPGDAWHANAGPAPIAVRFGESGMIVDGVPGGGGQRVPVGQVELSSGSGTATVVAIRLLSPDGEVVLEDRFGWPTPSARVRALCGLAGGLLGAACALLVRAGLGGVLECAGLLVPPLLVLATGYPAWQGWTERLYLTAASPSDLRRFFFAVAFLPLFGAAMVASRALAAGSPAHTPFPTGRRATAAACVACALLCVVASRDLHGLQWAAVVPGFAFAAWPLWTARQTGQPLAMLRDLPAFLALALGGWGFGLLPAALWRFTCLFADAPAMVRAGGRAEARAGTQAFGVTTIATLVGIEIAVRASFVGVAWDPALLAGNALDAADQPHAAFKPFWSGSCPTAGGGGGEASASTIYTFGGSSAGGAYQFRNEPEAFFPARLHALLCAQRTPGSSIVSHNFGESGRDSFDAANAVDTLFAQHPPAISIVYLGVNDLLTADHPLSRREMAERRAAMGAAAETLSGISSSIRVITGLSLLTRTPEVARLVVAVPLADAEVNLRRIIASTTALGGQVLLVPEYAAANVAGTLRPYFAMEERLAGELPGTRYVDLYAALEPAGGATLLADRNHLTREGCVKVAETLAPMAAALLGSP